MPDSYSRVYVHCVWSTWNRQPWLVGEVRKAVLACLRAECERLGAEVLALNAVSDHVHILIWLPPTLALAAVMKQCKGASSHLANHTVGAPELFRWQGSYHAFSVDADRLDVVSNYIARQPAHHGETPRG